MELAFAFLAENADATAEGQLWAAAIDFDVLQCPQFPMFKSFSLVAKVRFTAEELGRHTFRFDITGPDNERKQLGPEQVLEATAHRFDPTADTAASVIVNLGVVISTPGIHQFHVVVDNQDVKTIRLLVRLQPEATQPATVGE